MSTFIDHEAVAVPKRSRRRLDLNRIKKRVRILIKQMSRKKKHPNRREVGRLASVHYCGHDRRDGCCQNAHKVVGPPHAELAAREAERYEIEHAEEVLAITGEIEATEVIMLPEAYETESRQVA